MRQQCDLVVAATALLVRFCRLVGGLRGDVGRRVARFDSFRPGVCSAWLGASAISAALTGIVCAGSLLGYFNDLRRSERQLSADMYASNAMSRWRQRRL